MNNDTIIIKVEEVETVFGKMVKFWQGNGFRQVKQSEVLETMNDLTTYYNNTCGKAVMFMVR